MWARSQCFCLAVEKFSPFTVHRSPFGVRHSAADLASKGFVGAFSLMHAISNVNSINIVQKSVQRRLPLPSDRPFVLRSTAPFWERPSVFGMGVGPGVAPATSTRFSGHFSLDRRGFFRNVACPHFPCPRPQNRFSAISGRREGIGGDLWVGSVGVSVGIRVQQTSEHFRHASLWAVAF
jgi:hypothetical protein